MRLIMISAMYENGGNVFHRHLDGHPQLHVYPFESQLGTRFVEDELLSMFPFKYRWPEFPLGGNVAGDYELFFDEEMKTYLRRPGGSKFRDADLQMTDAERKEFFLDGMKGRERTRGNLVTAFFEATFKAWKNLTRSGRETFFVGYSPIVVVDAEKILGDLPDSHIIHIVRNPLACYAETCKRPFPLSLERYTWTWNLVQHRALVYRDLYPDRVLIIRYEDLITRKAETLKDLCGKIGLQGDDCLLFPSWNGQQLKEAYPWGTIHEPDLSEQETRIAELGPDRKSKIETISRVFMRELDYD